MNEFEEKCHTVCKRVLKRHYDLFRKDIKDGFFYNTPAQGQRRLTEMLGNVRREIDGVVQLGRNRTDLEVIKETIMGEYMQIGRKYGERVLKKAVKASLFLKASLFFGQHKNQLFLYHEEEQIYGNTDRCDAATVRIGNEGHRHLS